MIDRRTDLLEALLQNAQRALHALRQGEFDLSPHEREREALFSDLVAADTEFGPPGDTLLPQLERLRAANDVLLAEVQKSLTELEQRLGAVARGRKGLSGYLGSAQDGARGAKLGRG